MRKLVASFFISLDGVVEAPDKWHFPYFNEEMGAAVGEAMGATDSLLLGRRTYDEWAAYWPHQDPASDPFVSIMNDTPKYVASTTLTEVDWQNSTLLEGDLATYGPFFDLSSAVGDPVERVTVAESGTAMGVLGAAMSGTTIGVSGACGG